MTSIIDKKLKLIHNQEKKTTLLRYSHGFRFFCQKSLSLIEIQTQSFDIAKEFFLDFSEQWNFLPSTKVIESDTFFLSIYFSNRCNLNCSYCYIHGNGSNKIKIIDEIASNHIIINEIQKLIRKNPKLLEINFFGGEPLLYKDRIFEILYFVNQEFQNIKSSITTNGILLTPDIIEKLKLFKTEILLSLDSPPENHNIYRAGNNSKYSFDNIVRRIKGFEDYISVVTTITKKTPSLKQSLETLINYGFKDVGFNIVYTNNKSLSIQKDDSQKIVDEIINNENWFIDNSDKITNIKRLKHLISNRVIKSSPCSSGKNSYAITSTGKRYFCHSCVGDSSFEITDNMPSKEIIEKRLINNIKKSLCNCWAFHLCGGECWLIQLNFPENQRKLRCDIIKALIKIALSCDY